MYLDKQINLGHNSTT